MPVAVTESAIFLSWCRRDLALKNDLVRRLAPNLAILSGVGVRWWEDSDIYVGEDLGEAILQQLDACDYGLLLLSPDYYASGFITRHELPRFSGPGEDRRCFPVALRPVPLDGSRYVYGLERKLIFYYGGKAYRELRGAGRDAFASELATQIRRRILSGR